MKAKQVLLFIVGVFALLGVGWIAFPADGVPVGSMTLRFPSYKEKLIEEAEVKVNVDSILIAVEETPDKILLPNDDITFFDSFFRRIENADSSIVRVVHYGDSQIEMDRISQDLREALQIRFGGCGTGLFPAVTNVPSASINKSASGGFVQYTMYGDSTTRRAGHNRYGLMAQVVQLSGGGTITLRSTRNKTARERVKTFESVSVLYGRESEKFEIKASSDTSKPQPVVRKAENGTWVTWHFGKPVQKAVISIKGNAEIYGVSADGKNGVAVDNIPLRGSSGTIFSRISQPLMQDCLSLTDTRLVILQFGGNMMPVVHGTKAIQQYQEQIEKQIRYFQQAAPRARILFIGPSDMGKSVNGRIVTWPRLPEMVDSLKATALRNNVAYWDLYRMMGGENSMVQWVKHSPAYAGPDYIHFTPAGARRVGEALSRSLLTYHDFYRLRKTLPAERVNKAMRP